MWLCGLVAACLVAMATAQSNEYLPPNTGYNYDKPSIPFPTNNNGNQHEHHEHHDQQDHEHHEHHQHHEPGMPFDFNYAVNENGNDYSHNAISDGDVTKGEYRVALPDGRTQIVKYTADWKNGFNAEVSYEGEAQFPDQPKYGSGSGGQGYSEGGGYQY
ncbi:cuticular protein RR-2 motif 131 precursor [Bombyx mori]|uniref:Putative cuticle protein n=1 Tax=Bombyx mori TaxID=7091 RepID=C0H6X3_BOMMO|nr:cuticular protein RR-2 motif 131 precursor [Bombyx mori]FAA00634.1 TPA: putative cuticle protein [Bombyx mori]